MSEEQNLKIEEINRTRDELSKKLAKFEASFNKSKETAENAIGEVGDAVHHIKDAAKKLSPTYQAQHNPLPAFGVASAAGFAVGYLVTKPRYRSVSPTREMAPRGAVQVLDTRSRPSWMVGLAGQLQETFSDEIQLVKTMVAGAAVKAIGNKIRESSPHIAEQVSEVERSLMEKINKTRSSESH